MVPKPPTSPAEEAVAGLAVRLRGDFNYFAVSGNSKKMYERLTRVTRIWLFWLRKTKSKAWPADVGEVQPISVGLPPPEAPNPGPNLGRCSMSLSGPRSRMVEISSSGSEGAPARRRQPSG